MKNLLVALSLGLLLVACGGSPAPADEEVSATWTSGDDDSLETAEGSAE